MRRTVRSCRKRVLKRRLRFRHQKRQKRSRKRCSINAFSTQALLIVSTAKPPGPHSCVVAKSDEIGDAEATLRCGRPGRSRSHRARLRPRHEVRCASFPLRRRRSLPNPSSSTTTRQPVSSPRLVVCVSHAQDVRPERRFSTPHDGQDARPRARLFAAFSLFLLTSNCFVTV